MPTWKQKLKAIKAGIKTGNNQYYRSTTASDVKCTARKVHRAPQKINGYTSKKVVLIFNINKKIKFSKLNPHHSHLS